MIAEIAFMERTENGKNAWRLKLDDDVEFLDMFPEVADRQRDILQKIQSEMRTLLTEVGTKSRPKSRSVSNGTGSHHASSHAAHGAHGALSSGSSSHGTAIPVQSSHPTVSPVSRTALEYQLRGETKIDQLNLLVDQLFKVFYVLKFDTLKKAILDKAAEGSNKLAEGVADDDVRISLARSYMEIQPGLYCLRTSSDSNVEYAQFREVVIATFKKAKVARKGDLVNLSMSMHQKKPTDTIYKRVLTEFATSRGGSWNLKDGTGML